MQLVAPSAVRMADAIEAISWIMNFVVSFFVITVNVYWLLVTGYCLLVTGYWLRVHRCIASIIAAAAALILSSLGGVWGGLITLHKAVHVDELGLLQELTAGDVVLLLLLGEESDVQTLDVRVHVELVLAHCTALVALQRGVERAESLDLHLLRVEQHLDQTATELLQYAVNDVGGVNRSVLADVGCQLTGVQTLKVLYSAVPLTESLRVRVLILVHFIDNLCHR